MDEAKRTFLEMIEVVAKHKPRKVLFNAELVKGTPNEIERFDFGKFAAETAVGHGVAFTTAFAYVMKEPLLDPMRFGEIVAVNRGMSIKTFDEDTDALEWLRRNHP